MDRKIEKFYLRWNKFKNGYNSSNSINRKIKKIKKEVIHKQKLSKIYYNLLKNNKEISLPKYKKDRFTNFHLFTIKANQRSKLKEYLKKME